MSTSVPERQLFSYSFGIDCFQISPGQEGSARITRLSANFLGVFIEHVVSSPGLTLHYYYM